MKSTFITTILSALALLSLGTATAKTYTVVVDKDSTPEQAADAMTRFKNEGVLNPATGADYRRCILERGSSVPAMQQIRDFLGRDPDPAALIERYRVPTP